MIIDRDTLRAAEPHIRALARAIKAERREVVEALEAFASIEQAPHKPMQSRPPPVVEPGLSRFMPVPKERPRRSETYRRWVASLPCAHCGIAGYSQAAHADQGKGIGLKAGDDQIFPACADRPGVRGCHTIIGATGTHTRDQRRELEGVYIAATQGEARAIGHWPKEWD